MNTNVNLAAPVGVLALLGAGFILSVTAIFLIQSLIVRKWRRAKICLVAMIAICSFYATATLIFSLASHEQLLAAGQEKHFCEIDCHLAYSIGDVRQAKTLGEGEHQSVARGIYEIITVTTRFDETTIAPWRGNALLYPNSRAITLIDDRGNRYAPASENGTPLTTPLQPGQSYKTEFVFDVPVEVKRTTLLVNESDWITHLIIGHENSLLHKRTSFQIDLPAAARVPVNSPGQV